MKTKIISILILSAIIILTVTIFTNRKETAKPVKSTDLTEQKTIKKTATSAFAYDKVSTLYDGKSIVLTLDDKKIGCNANKLGKQVKSLPPLDLLNSIYVNDKGGYFLAPEKTMIFSAVLFRQNSLTEKEFEEIKITPFSKLTPKTIVRMVAYTYYGARVGESKRVVRSLISSHPTTKTVILSFRKKIKKINYLDFLPEEAVKFNGLLLFENRVISGKIIKAQIPQLMRSKVNLGSKDKPKYGITLSIKDDKRVEKTVYSCDDLVKSFAEKFMATTAEAISAQRTFYTIFNVLSAASSHAIPKRNFILSKGLNNLKNIPVTMLPAITRKGITELTKRGGSIADLTKGKAAVKIIRAEREYLHLFYNHDILFGEDKSATPEQGMELKLTEIMRGDLNFDGINDIFLQAEMSSPNNKANFSAFMLITLDERDGLFKQMNIPWK